MYILEIVDINQHILISIKIEEETHEDILYKLIYDLKSTLFKYYKDYKSIYTISRENPSYNEAEVYEEQDELINKIFFHKITKC